MDSNRCTACKQIFNSQIAATDWDQAITVPHWVDGTLYHLHFPLSQLENAIAICGWLIVNHIDRSNADVQNEIARLAARPHIAILNAQEWFRTYASKPYDVGKM